MRLNTPSNPKAIHPYLDDIAFLLNLACKNATGYDLPSGFYTDDWKYKIEDGKKKAVRQMPHNFLTNPLSTINYTGTESNILKINLHDELKEVFKTYNNYYPVHLLYPIYDGVMRYAIEKDVAHIHSQQTSRSPATPADEWMENRDRIRRKIYHSTNSALCARAPIKCVEFLTQIIYEYCITAHESGLYDTTPTTQGGGFAPFIPNCIRTISYSGFWTETITLGKRPNDLSLPRRTIYKNDLKDHRYTTCFIKDTMESIAPALLYAGASLPSAKWWIRRFSKNLGVVDKNDRHPKHGLINKIIRRHTSDLTDSIDKELKKNYWNKIGKRKGGMMCQDCSPLVKQSVWSEYFWKINHYTYLNQRIDNRLLGRWIYIKTDKRKNFWSNVNIESGLLDDALCHYLDGLNPDYHNDTKYKERFAQEVIKETLAL